MRPLTVALCAALAVAPTLAQSTSDIKPAAALDPNLPQDIAAAPTTLPPAAAPEPGRWLRSASAAYTFLPGGGDNTFGNNDFELSATFALPWPAASPLLLSPAFGVHLWEGPVSRQPGDPDLPARVFDASFDIGWKPRPYEWLFLDLGLTPGVYGDFTTGEAELFRLRGRSIAIVALSEQFQFVAGVSVTNRNRTMLLPVAGFLWNPDEDTKLQVVFPAPKLSRRVLTTASGTQWWGYLSGEFGGGTWAVSRADGSPDSVDYNDLRLILGAEAVTPCAGPKGRLELGYVFNREVSYYKSPTRDFEPDATVMLRAGWSF